MESALECHHFFYHNINLTFVDLCVFVQFIIKSTNKMQQFSEFFTRRLFVTQHVSGVVPPIIRSIQLHPQSLVLHTLQVEGCSVVGRGRAEGRVYYLTFICGPICFGRHTAHHQEHTTAPAASGFAYVAG